MQLLRRQFLILAGGVAALPFMSPFAFALDYPSQPVRLIVPYAPGGTTDAVARLIGPGLSERLAQPFVVESRPGAGTNVGTEAVVHSSPDGYTLLLFDPAAAINATLYRKLNFNFIQDIAPIIASSAHLSSSWFTRRFRPNANPRIDRLCQFLTRAKIKAWFGRQRTRRNSRASRLRLNGRHVDMTPYSFPKRQADLPLPTYFGGQVNIVLLADGDSPRTYPSRQVTGFGGDKWDTFECTAGGANRTRICSGAMRRVTGWVSAQPKKTDYGHRHAQ